MDEEEDERDRGRDVTGDLRARIYELYEHFRSDPNLINRAHDRIGDPRAWAERVADEAEVATRHGLDDTPAAQLAPVDALRALEVADRAAYIATSPSWRGMPQRFGNGERARYVVRRIRMVRPLSGRQSGRISAHLRYHTLIPQKITIPGGADVTVRFVKMRNGRPRAAQVAGRGQLRVGTTSFEDRGVIDFGEPHGPARTVAGAAARGADLLWVVKAAAGDRVDVLVAPELTLPPAQRDELHLAFADLRQQLALAVLGSFHEERDGRVFNVAHLVDGNGNQLVSHRKLIRFGNLDVPDKPPEQIEVGDEVRVLLSPFGTVVVAICRDFCDDRHAILWQEIQPDLLLVPAYGAGASAHVRAAREAARDAGTVTVVAHEALNSVPLARETEADPKGESFVHTAQQHLETRCHEHAPLFSAVNIPLSLADPELDPRGSSN